MEYERQPTNKDLSAHMGVVRICPKTLASVVCIQVSEWYMFCVLPHARKVRERAADEMRKHRHGSKIICLFTAFLVCKCYWQYMLSYLRAYVEPFAPTWNPLIWSYGEAILVYVFFQINYVYETLVGLLCLPQSLGTIDPETGACQPEILDPETPGTISAEPRQPKGQWDHPRLKAKRHDSACPHADQGHVLRHEPHGNHLLGVYCLCSAGWRWRSILSSSVPSSSTVL